MQLRPYWDLWWRWHTHRRFQDRPGKRAEWNFVQRARRLRAGDVAVDCGANVGEYTELLARRGATVHAFEPDPVAFAAAQLRLARFPNVRLYNQAVGTEAGRATLYRAKNFTDAPEDRTISSTLIASKTNVDAANVVEVEVIDFPAFLAALPGRVAMLKVDIEGAEVALVNALLDRGVIDKVDATFVETHERNVPALREATAELRRRVAREGRTTVDLNWQ